MPFIACLHQHDVSETLIGMWERHASAMAMKQYPSPACPAVYAPHTRGIGTGSFPISANSNFISSSDFNAAADGSSHRL